MITSQTFQNIGKTRHVTCKTIPSLWHLGYLKVKKETFLFNRGSRSEAATRGVL